MSAHTCHARRPGQPRGLCPRRCHPSKLMCGPCWALVPADWQAAVVLQYKRGKEKGTHPTEAWMLAAWRANYFVWATEAADAELLEDLLGVRETLAKALGSKDGPSALLTGRSDALERVALARGIGQPQRAS